MRGQRATNPTDRTLCRRAWVRAVLAVGLVTRLLDPRSRWVRRLYGSVITRRKLVKSKVQNCKHPALDMSHDDLGPKLALAVAQGLPPGAGQGPRFGCSKNQYVPF